MNRMRFAVVMASGFVVVLALSVAFGCNAAKTPEENVLTLIGKASGMFGCQGCNPDEGEGEGEGESEGEQSEGEGEPAEDEGEGEPTEGEAPEGEGEDEGEGEQSEGEGEPPIEGEPEGEPDHSGDLVVMLPGDVPLALMHIPAGTFLMGRYSGEQDSYDWEDPQHSVTISEGFYLGKYEVTKRQWQAVAGTTPWSGQSYVLDDLDSPAVYVSWNDAQSFITALNTHITSTGQGAATFRLPTEAEWEYACRAGTTTRFYWGDDPSYTLISDYAWWYGNTGWASEEYAHVVGLKLPNAFGLYDMSGNVWEWCEDDWHGNYTGAPTNGSAWVDSPRGSYRLLRGGSWDNSGGYCRSASRVHGYPVSAYSVSGFRVARTP